MKKTLIAIATLLTFTGTAYSAVNINTATQAELQTVKGITAANAKAIIDYRSKAGSFRATDDIANVEGINSHTMDMQQLREDITVTGPTVLKMKDKAAVK
ncbi:ComEA family DNA-binding protein [Nitrosovibrio sp. Nv4]|uniref:ComEA family DNA-binding protein n=1 Tax=Nitrosovibrio sp. Nv4 TaxID=1945880 RepID=UPI000BD83839|nr:helix-hairpin-helix domain-containing protein [Nitrosovibrio sp. Nv4]SOD42077.1 competence protein ComEA [Nitrosovibrio sp. Nv4]